MGRQPWGFEPLNEGLPPPAPPTPRGWGHLVQDSCCRESCLRAVAGSLAFLPAKGRPGIFPDGPPRLTSGGGGSRPKHTRRLVPGEGVLGRRKEAPCGLERGLWRNANISLKIPPLFSVYSV